MFRDREDAARRLAKKLETRELRDPLVLAIPRGGVVTGAVLARALGADLDVVLSRKLRAPNQPELAIGAISEGGEVYLNPQVTKIDDWLGDYLAEERAYQMAEIARRRKLFRAVRPVAPIADRSVIVTDDGIATGSTMIAALKVIQTHQPHELIVAVPVASPDRLQECVSGATRWFACLPRRGSGRSASSMKTSARSRTSKWSRFCVLLPLPLRRLPGNAFGLPSRV